VPGPSATAEQVSADTGGLVWGPSKFPELGIHLLFVKFPATAEIKAIEMPIIISKYLGLLLWGEFPLMPI